VPELPVSYAASRKFAVMHAKGTLVRIASTKTSVVSNRHDVHGSQYLVQCLEPLIVLTEGRVKGSPQIWLLALKRKAMGD
jgi:hypothetical protein